MINKILNIFLSHRSINCSLCDTGLLVSSDTFPAFMITTPLKCHSEKDGGDIPNTLSISEITHIRRYYHQLLNAKHGATSRHLSNGRAVLLGAALIGISILVAPQLVTLTIKQESCAGSPSESALNIISDAQNNADGIKDSVANYKQSKNTVNKPDQNSDEPRYEFGY